MLRRSFLSTVSGCAAAAAAGCSPGADPAARTPTQALNFPGSAGVRRTMRFRFLAPLKPYPATYIWRVFPRQQSGYYTAFFWGNDDGLDNLKTFLWTPDGDADTYYGAHPYPQPPPAGSRHRWEVSVVRRDLLGSEVVYDRWYTQALRVWASPLGKHHAFYWDLPRTDRHHRVTFVAPPTWGNRRPPVPALNWGDAPWAPGEEVWCGLLGGIQIFEACLPISDVLAEAAHPRSTPLGNKTLWYENLKPDPTQMLDTSGRGHHPSWVGPERPTLWYA